MYSLNSSHRQENVLAHRHQLTSPTFFLPSHPRPTNTTRRNILVEATTSVFKMERPAIKADRDNSNSQSHHVLPSTERLPHAEQEITTPSVHKKSMHPTFAPTYSVTSLSQMLQMEMSGTLKTMRSSREFGVRQHILLNPRAPSMTPRAVSPQTNIATVVWPLIKRGESEQALRKCHVLERDMQLPARNTLVHDLVHTEKRLPTLLANTACAVPTKMSSLRDVMKSSYR